MTRSHPVTLVYNGGCWVRPCFISKDKYIAETVYISRRRRGTEDDVFAGSDFDSSEMVQGQSESGLNR